MFREADRNWFSDEYVWESLCKAFGLQNDQHDTLEEFIGVGAEIINRVALGGVPAEMLALRRIEKMSQQEIACKAAGPPTVKTREAAEWVFYLTPRERQVESITGKRGLAAGDDYHFAARSFECTTLVIFPSKDCRRLLTASPAHFLVSSRDRLLQGPALTLRRGRYLLFPPRVRAGCGAEELRRTVV